MRLQYDVAIVGLAAIDRALAGIEKRFARHNATMSRQAQRAARPGGAAADTAAVAAEDRRHSKAMSHIRAERAAQTAAHRDIVRQFDRDARAAAREQSRSRRTFGNAIRGGLGAAGRTLSTIGSYGAMALGIGGGMLFHQTLQNMRAGESSARTFANQAYANPDGSRTTQAQRGAIYNQVRAQAKVSSLASGFTQDKVVGAMRSFNEKAGVVDPGIRLADFFTRTADATGADLGDIGLMAGQIYKAASNRGIKGAALEDTVKKLTGAFAGQGMGGQIEIKDFAGLIGRLTATAQGFSGDFVQSATSLGAIAQMSAAGGGSTSPEEAMTSLARFRSDLVKKGGDAQGKFLASGIDVFTDKSQTALKDPAELIMQAVAKTKGNMPALVDMFGERGIRAVEGFRSTYTDAGGGAAGEKAMRDQFAQYMGLSLSETDINERAADTRGTQEKRWEIMMRSLEEKLGPSVERVMATLLPALEKAAPRLEQLAEVVASLIEFFAANPFVGIGAMVGASIVSEMAKAAIGAKIAALLEGAPGGGGGAAGVSSAGLALTAAIIGVALAVDQASKLFGEVQDHDNSVAGQKKDMLDAANRQGRATETYEVSEWDRTMTGFGNLFSKGAWDTGPAEVELYRGKDGSVQERDKDPIGNEFVPFKPTSLDRGEGGYQEQLFNLDKAYENRQTDPKAWLDQVGNMSGEASPQYAAAKAEADAIGAKQLQDAAAALTKAAGEMSAAAKAGGSARGRGNDATAPR